MLHQEINHNLRDIVTLSVHNQVPNPFRLRGEHISITVDMYFSFVFHQTTFIWEAFFTFITWKHDLFLVVLFVNLQVAFVLKGLFTNVTSIGALFFFTWFVNIAKECQIIIIERWILFKNFSKRQPIAISINLTVCL